MPATYDAYNPIRTVDGAYIYTPASYVYKLEDVSAADAGRTEDGNMQKMRIGQLVKLELKWTYLSTAKCSEILQAFNPQYITVNYLDLLTGGYRTAVFYVGNRSAPSYNTRLNLWEDLSFNIIERDCSR